MEQVIAHGAELDVHKDSIAACVRWQRRPPSPRAV